MLRGLFGGNGNPLTGFQAVTELKSHAFFLLLCLLACTPLFRWAGEKWREAGQKNRLLARLYGLAAWGVMPVLLLLLSTASLVGNSYNPFLYFQF